LYVRLTDHKTDGICFADPRADELGFRVLSPAATGTPAPSQARFACMVPEQDLDYGSVEVFPSDINMDLQNGIAWRKGCYVGQEVVSRMKRRGSIRKRICLLTVAGTSPPLGADVLAGAGKIGKTCSDQGQQILALLRTDRVAKAIDQGQEFRISDQTVAITVPKETHK